MRSVPHPKQPRLFAEETKVCVLCHECLPVDRFSFKVQATGRRDSRCKACMNAKCAARYAANPERQHEASQRWRTANPEKRKAADEAWRLANREQTRLKTARWYVANRERKQATNAAWLAANAERQKANVATWNAANLERKKATTRAWQTANTERIKAKSKAWRLANPGRVAAFDLRRRHRIRVAGKHYTGAEWFALKARYDFRCLMCHRQEPDITLTFDHVVPVSKGGTNDIANGQPLCLSCNSRKHTQVLDLR